jgi:hypothetical protein
LNCLKVAHLFEVEIDLNDSIVVQEEQIASDYNNMQKSQEKEVEKKFQKKVLYKSRFFKKSDDQSPAKKVYRVSLFII